MLTLILAAGQGKRMHSQRPKVLQPLAGKPLICHLLDRLAHWPGRLALVYGHGGDLLKAELAPRYPELQWIEQAEALGTGHAVAQALPFIQPEETVLVLYGDTTQIARRTLEALLARAEQNDLTLLSAWLANPHGYGRILRNASGQIQAIVEERDATPEQRLIQEIHTGVLAARGAVLHKLLPRLNNHNPAGEFYLTDLVALAGAEGLRVEALPLEDSDEMQGVNDRRQLAALEAFLRRQAAEALLDQGVTLVDPARIDVQGPLTVGRDVYLEPNIMFKGQNVLGDGVRIESNCVLENCHIGAGTVILSHSRLEGVQVGADCHIGPFARLRPQTILADGVKVGNFVELKASEIKSGTKINHLSYIGDSNVGVGVNIGAGTITCNYDGANKFKTVIGDNVFIGSNSALVAPLNIGSDATVGAGSVIRKDVKNQSLVLTVGERREKENWPRPVKKK